MTIKSINPNLVRYTGVAAPLLQSRVPQLHPRAVELGLQRLKPTPERSVARVYAAVVHSQGGSRVTTPVGIQAATRNNEPPADLFDLTYVPNVPRNTSQTEIVLTEEAEPDEGDEPTQSMEVPENLIFASRPSDVPPMPKVVTPPAEVPADLFAGVVFKPQGTPISRTAIARLDSQRLAVRSSSSPSSDDSLPATRIMPPVVQAQLVTDPANQPPIQKVPTRLDRIQEMLRLFWERVLNFSIEDLFRSRR